MLTTTATHKAGFDPLPEGEYDLVAFKAQETESKKDKTPMIKVEYAIDGHKHRLFQYYLFSGKQFHRKQITDLWLALGNTANEDQEITLDADSIQGEEIHVTLGIRKGKDQNGEEKIENFIKKYHKKEKKYSSF
jgi:3',5'-cyclic AMP phosphodiesterase CpdA